jgi:hypothetical protein
MLIYSFSCSSNWLQAQKEVRTAILAQADSSQILVCRGLSDTIDKDTRRILWLLPELEQQKLWLSS